MRYPNRISNLIAGLSLMGLFNIPLLPGETVPMGNKQDLAKGFINPPDEAKQGVYWWWEQNWVDNKSITRDLEEYRAKGVARVILVSAGVPAGPMPEGPDFMSPAWRELVKHALKEAARLNIEVSINLCSGWNAGGPWITDEYGCKQYVQSKITLKGPQSFAGKLPQPGGNAKAYQDVAVQAFRTPVKNNEAAKPKPLISVLTSSEQPNYPGAKAVDDDFKTMWVSSGVAAGEAPTAQRPEWLQLNYSQPVETSMLWIRPRPKFGPKEVEVQTSADGTTFTTVIKASLKAEGAQTIKFPATRSAIFRLLIKSSHGAENCQIADMALEVPESIQRGQSLAIKAARGTVHYLEPIRVVNASPLGAPPFPANEQPIDPGQMVDLTAALQPDGTLTWNVPAGEWTVLRTGYVSMGRKVQYATKGGEGLELDFFDTKALDLHFKSMAQVLMDDSPEMVGKTLKYFTTDSWEAGLPNWTGDFLGQFQKFRGYDARPYLPVLSGYAVGSAEISDRFLHDLRKTIGDCLADNHYARFAELCHANGMGTHSEAAGSCTDFVPMDSLKNLGRGDYPMGEFWQDGKLTDPNRQNYNGKQTSSAAHIYGKRWALAEAFTRVGGDWIDGPSQLKPVADIAFCEGINRFFHHNSTSVKDEDGKPGYVYFAGTHFNRNVTWWEQAGAWSEYIARCQWLLSQGRFVADVCYYNGDGTPNFVEPKQVNPVLGKGFDYDVFNTEVLLTRMSVKDGRIVLPDGMSYRVLVLSDRKTMPVEVLEKLAELVKAGATVIGPRPEKDPGLRGYPESDARIQKLGAELWGDCDGVNVKEHAFGQGRVVWGKPIRDVLTASGVTPDFSVGGAQPDTFLDWIHRSAGDTEIYFIANRNNRAETATCTFRVRGKQPELWDPVTGTQRDAGAFSQGAEGTTLTLELPSYGSQFVVFRRAIATDAVGKEKSNYPHLTPVLEIKGPWEVTFDPAWGGPSAVEFPELVDWTQRPEDGIRFYSGKATYIKSFTLTEAQLAGKSGLSLDLGDLNNVAEVRLNGKPLGVLWTKPYRVALGDAAKAGSNSLEIDIVNLWPNRLGGDKLLAPEKRFTRTNQALYYKWPRKPLPSGLLGPVTLQTAAAVQSK